MSDDPERDEMFERIEEAATGVMALIPQWFRDLTERHVAEADRLLAEGRVHEAAAFAYHGPSLEDIAGDTGCSAGGSQYPCSVARSIHDGSRVWGDLVKHFPEGWDSEPDECAEVEAMRVTVAERWLVPSSRRKLHWAALDRSLLDGLVYNMLLDQELVTFACGQLTKGFTLATDADVLALERCRACADATADDIEGGVE